MFSFSCNACTSYPHTQSPPHRVVNTDHQDTTYTYKSSSNGRDDQRRGVRYLEHAKGQEAIPLHNELIGRRYDRGFGGSAILGGALLLGLGRCGLTGGTRCYPRRTTHTSEEKVMSVHTHKIIIEKRVVPKSSEGITTIVRRTFVGRDQFLL